ncbi:unnamed protein product [Lymnaea stagnalis]|uniref:Protein kinase domain-containing protein n=1 Tax=Lymnaea stagnalis TaxID=6523 RepID=A0AAV2ICB4_LYMST
MSKRYVDNAMNRSLGRVGMPHGTAVHSRSSSNSSSSSGSSSSSKTYVDNPLNRSLGRVGMEHGTAVHSRSSSGTSSPNTYVDNPLNRSLGRVGMEHGTAVHSRANDTLTLKFDGLTIADCSVKVYKDNALNRKLGRVGLPLGSVKHSRQSSAPGPAGATAQPTIPNPNSGRVYVDNSYNRKHNRVGKPLGSMPIPAKERVYKNTPRSRQLGRVGLPWGTYEHKKRPQNALLKKLMALQEDDDIPDDIVNDYETSAVVQDMIDHYLEMRNRERYLRNRLEVDDTASWHPHEHTSRLIKDKYKGNVIDYGELKIADKIGHGGFGDVFTAEWLEDELVAVKKLRVQRVSKKRLEQFEDEINVYCQLEHENIVRFLGASIVPPNLAIVMEYMDMSLYDALHLLQVDFTNDDKINITRHVANGMAYLHDNDIAHCDLKTQNVLLNNVPGNDSTDDKQPVLAKITDFGLSKIKSDGETNTSSPATRHVGTPLYSAPEVLRGELLNTDALMKADVYSLGLVILELVTEETAFEDLTLRQLEVQVGEKGLKPDSSRDLTIDPRFLRELEQCWHSDPNKRPSSKTFSLFAETFLGDLN